MRKRTDLGALAVIKFRPVGFKWGLRDSVPPFFWSEAAREIVRKGVHQWLIAVGVFIEFDAYDIVHVSDCDADQIVSVAVTLVGENLRHLSPRDVVDNLFAPIRIRLIDPFIVK